MTRLEELSIEELKELEEKVKVIIERKLNKLPKYAVFRNGANAANQGWVYRVLVWVGRAANSQDACRKAMEEVTCYNNQHLDAIPVTRLRGEDLRDYHNWPL